jgi:hypothetical protein
MTFVAILCCLVIIQVMKYGSSVAFCTSMCLRNYYISTFMITTNSLVLLLIILLLSMIITHKLVLLLYN